MGLMDILNGMQNGPRGQEQPASPGSKHGMSPMMMALLGLLAYKALKGSGGSGQPQVAPDGAGRQAMPSAGAEANAQEGGLGDILGGLFGGASAGRSGAGGLGDILGGMLGGSRPGGGGLGDILGGVLGGGNAGNVLKGGLGNILADLERNGQGKTAQSWVSAGENESISPGDLEQALGADTLDALAKQSGVPRGQLLAGFSEHLPELVNQLTPDGRLPSQDEASRWV
jgi:uncharacterized protein YidB (DUF937 family)